VAGVCGMCQCGVVCGFVPVRRGATDVRFGWFLVVW